MKRVLEANDLFVTVSGAEPNSTKWHFKSRCFTITNGKGMLLKSSPMLFETKTVNQHHLKVELSAESCNFAVDYVAILTK